MKYYMVDAFADAPFSGNPAGVCVLEQNLEEAVMQRIAEENNLSETAFLLRQDGGYALRWFTPSAEIDLCGHATLASAYVVCRFLEPAAEKVCFSTLSGPLYVKRSGDFYEMDFPSRPFRAIPLEPRFAQALGIAPQAAFLARDYCFLLHNAQEIKDCKPDFERLALLKEGMGIIVTAKGDDCDFVSRFFCPELGVREDPVTGSSHCSLVPFWSSRLGKKNLLARQLSKRGGTLRCRLCGERVSIGGTAALYLRGSILEPSGSF